MWLRIAPNLIHIQYTQNSRVEYILLKVWCVLQSLIFLWKYKSVREKLSVDALLNLYVCVYNLKMSRWGFPQYSERTV